MPLKKLLMIPGPTPLPQEVKLAMAREMVGHRSKDFSALFKEIIPMLKKCFQTEGDVMVMPGSGTIGMEAAVANIISPNDKAVVLNTGNFGGRWTKILKAYGAQVVEIKYAAGQAAQPEDLKKALEENKDAKAVYLQHNETSTAVLNDVKALAEVAHQHGVLTVVDSISGLLTADLPMDSWKLDVVVAGAQKAFMIPPGLAMVAVSKRFWDAQKNSKSPKFYMDLAWYKKTYDEKGETPTTPAISLIVGLHEALKLILAEGLPNMFNRHERMMRAARAGARALGLKLLAEDKNASRAVTAVSGDFDCEALRKIVREKHGITLAGGQGDLKGKIFRIGHLGYAQESDILVAYSAIEQALIEMGQKIEIGASLVAIQKEIVK